MKRLCTLLAAVVLVASIADARPNRRITPIARIASDADVTAGTPGMLIDAELLKDVTDALTLSPIEWQGEWDSGTAYTAGQGVTLSGSSFTALQNSTNQTPTVNPAPVSNAYWSLVAAKGDTGATGATGATGPAGADGADGANGSDGAGYAATSTTSLAIGNGSKSFTTQAGLAYAVGLHVRIVSASDVGNYMEGDVTAYDSGTGAMTVSVGTTGGSGTHTDWNIGIAGKLGESQSVTDLIVTGTLSINGGIPFSATLGTDDTFNGLTVTGLNNSGGVTQWDVVYLNGSSQWVLADANGSGTYPARGIAIATVSTGNATTVLVSGAVRNDAWDWTPGGALFPSVTAGGLTQTAPSTSGDKVQQVGFALTADIAWFNFGQGEYLTVQ